MHNHIYAGSGDVGQGAIDACKIGVTIATRYAAMRPQVFINPKCLYPNQPHIVVWCVETQRAGVQTLCISLHVPLACQRPHIIPPCVNSNARSHVACSTCHGCHSSPQADSSGRVPMQFNDTRIIEYLTHQRRLFPALATTYAMHLSTDALKVRPEGLHASQSCWQPIVVSSHDACPESLRHQASLNDIQTSVARNHIECSVHECWLDKHPWWFGMPHSVLSKICRSILMLWFESDLCRICHHSCADAPNCITNDGAGFSSCCVFVVQ